MKNQLLKKHMLEMMSKIPCEKFPKDKKRKDMELLRAAIIAEYDAVNLYEQFAELATDKLVKKIFSDVANEEKVHIGEFEYLLEKIDVEHEPNEEEGEEEVKEEE